MIVRRAIHANQPDRIVLNHLDYIDPWVAGGELTERATSFVAQVEQQIGRAIDWVGTGPDSVIERGEQLVGA
jgi:adenylosuccinate synthase